MNMAEEQVENAIPRPLKDHATPSLEGTTSSILRSAVVVAKFEIKPSTISMLQQSCQFYGLANEDPLVYISNFLEIYDTFKQNGVTKDAIGLKLFPFSLKDKAKT